MEYIDLSLNPDTICRKKLKGKNATNKDFALEVARLSNGNSIQGIPPMTDKQIAEVLGFKHYTSIQGFKKLAKELKLFDDLEKPPANRTMYVIPKDTKTFIDKYPKVQTWVKDMNKRAKGGRDLEGGMEQVRRLKVVCDTLKMHPDQFVTGDTKTAKDSATDCIVTFMELYMQGKAKLKYRGKYGRPWEPRFTNQNMVRYSHVQGLRNFMKSFGYIYPIGSGGAMHQSINEFHGNFADVRFSGWKQYREIKNWIADKYSLDSDVFRWFSVGVEAFPRAKALHLMKNEYEIFHKGKNEFYRMHVYESKTKQINKGIWEKLIKDADTKESINAVSKRSNFVIESRAKSFPNKSIYPQIRKAYKEFGLDKIHLEFDDIPESGYFTTHTSHALRHCGAQLWLDATNWQTNVVAPMGWATAEELTKSYGEMTAERRYKTLGEATFG